MDGVTHSIPNISFVKMCCSPFLAKMYTEYLPFPEKFMIPYYKTITTLSNNDNPFTIIGFLVYFQLRKGNFHANFNARNPFSVGSQSLFINQEVTIYCYRLSQGYVSLKVSDTILTENSDCSFDFCLRLQFGSSLEQTNAMRRLE